MEGGNLMYQKLINSDSLRHSEGNDSFPEERMVRDLTSGRAVSEELSSEIVDCGTHWECITKEIHSLFGGKIVIIETKYKTQWEKN